MDSFFKNMSSIIDAVTYVSQNDSSEDLRITYLPQIDKFQIISKNIKIFRKIACYFKKKLYLCTRNKNWPRGATE